MDHKGRIKIVSGIDGLYAIFTIIIGILVIVLGLGYLDLLNLSSSYPYGYNPFSWMDTVPWIFLFLGISTVIYGIKKLVDDILHILIINQERMEMYKQRPPSYQPPIQQQRQP
ncbi:MAG: hypothetical protein KAW45_08125 [Thermoplasmatales archaeon]|nr:hypothetical protein [Thermoplasmatales archaeon]